MVPLQEWTDSDLNNSKTCFVKKSTGDSGQRLLHPITNRCNLMLTGKVNSEIRPYSYGASLCALAKKDGGIRPIAIGSSFTRLVSKLYSQQLIM
jgi:hypothetical protein